MECFKEWRYRKNKTDLCLEVQFNDEISKMYLEGYKKLSYKIKNTKVTGDTAVINLI